MSCGDVLRGENAGCSPTPVMLDAAEPRILGVIVLLFRHRIAVAGRAETGGSGAPGSLPHPNVPSRRWASVAEGGRPFVADPLPQLDGATELGVGQQVALVELPGVEADRADQVPAARLLVAGQQVRQRRAASQATPAATPSSARRTASLAWNISVGRPASAAPTATRKATVTFSGSSRPVVRLITAFPAMAAPLSSVPLRPERVC